MADRPFDEIGIEELASGAGISRPTFYFYFATKDDVLLALLDRVIREVERRVATLPRDFGHEPGAAWRRSIGAFVEVFADHRSVAAAATAARMRNPAVAALWSRTMRSWVEFSAEVVLAERARGTAPGGPDATDLATALTLMNERVLTSVFTGETPSIDVDHALHVLSTIWIRAIYGHDDVS